MCRWYGPALVFGTVGRNVIVAHRRSILRCAREQLRPATSEEQPPPEILDAESRDLLKMRQLLDRGKFPQNQLVDLTSAEFPPSPEESLPSLPPATAVPAPEAAVMGRQSASDRTCVKVGATTDPSNPEPGYYGPVRSRVWAKSRPSC